MVPTDPPEVEPLLVPAPLLVELLVPDDEVPLVVPPLVVDDVGLAPHWPFVQMVPEQDGSWQSALSLQPLLLSMPQEPDSHTPNSHVGPKGALPQLVQSWLVWQSPCSS